MDSRVLSADGIPYCLEEENFTALTLGTAPFGSHPTGQFNFTRSGPETVLYWEDFLKRIQVEFGGKTVADSRWVKALHEAEKMMVLYFPQEDADMSVLERSDTRPKLSTKAGQLQLQPTTRPKPPFIPIHWRCARN